MCDEYRCICAAWQCHTSRARLDASSASNGHQDEGIASASINGNLVPMWLQLMYSPRMVAVLGHVFNFPERHIRIDI